MTDFIIIHLQTIPKATVTKIQLIISYQICSLNFMFLSLLIEELCTKEENNKAGCTLTFGGQCNYIR